MTEVTLIKGSQYELLLADTAGQDEYSMFPAEYSADVDGYVLVYSIGKVIYNAYHIFFLKNSDQKDRHLEC